MSKTATTTHKIVTAAMIAAAYCAISICLLPLSFGAIQIRVSEALTMLAIFSPAAIWGVTLGCALTNLIGFFTGANLIGMLDVVFGTAATLIAAILTYKLRNLRFHGIPVLSSIPPVIVNAVVIGAELTYVLFPMQLKFFIFNAAQVGVGQIVSCCVLGLLLVGVLERCKLDKRLFAAV